MKTFIYSNLQKITLFLRRTSSFTGSKHASYRSLYECLNEIEKESLFDEEENWHVSTKMILREIRNIWKLIRNRLLLILFIILCSPIILLAIILSPIYFLYLLITHIGKSPSEIDKSSSRQKITNEGINIEDIHYTSPFEEEIKAIGRTLNLEEKSNILTRIDNAFEDDSTQYISTCTYSVELPSNYTIDTNYTTTKNIKCWEDFKIASINQFFNPCYRVHPCTWSSLLSQWYSLNAAEDNIEITNCQHTKHLRQELDSSMDNKDNEQFSFFYAYQGGLITPISKRIGISRSVLKIYCYCPICKKLLCIGGKDIDKKGWETYFNLIECSKTGKDLIEDVDTDIRLLYANRTNTDNRYDRVVTNSHDPKECLKATILKNRYNIIWYPASALMMNNSEPQQRRYSENELIDNSSY